MLTFREIVHDEYFFFAGEITSCPFCVRCAPISEALYLLC